MGAADRHGGVVLLVEDDHDILDTLGEVLACEGYEVRLAANGREALASLRDETVPPDVILLDMMMPIMNGWEFLAEKRRDARIAPIPVVVVTADSKLNQASIVVEKLIRKPIDLELLLRTIENVRTRVPSPP